MEVNQSKKPGLDVPVPWVGGDRGSWRCASGVLGPGAMRFRSMVGVVVLEVREAGGGGAFWLFENGMLE